MRRSRVYESSPVGVRGQRAYLNCCAEIRTSLSPMGLLIELKRIEARLGRRPARRWSSRTIDIDILIFGALRRTTARLRIPHPRMRRRRFVLVPLAEIYPPAKTWLACLNAPSQNVNLMEEETFPSRP